MPVSPRIGAPILLPPEEIHLWLANYDAIRSEPLCREYCALLSDSERSQEPRFHFGRDRMRYLVTRVLLRTVLSRYAAVRPESWIFCTNAYGRPHIANEDAIDAQISFNISHTHSLIVLGVTRHRALGVDIEYCAAREVSIDRTQFHTLRSGRATQIKLVNRYAGATVPLKEERRTAVLVFHRQADGNFMSFYRTIPEVAPAPDWVHEVALAYYDYNGDDGQGWYRDIEEMARRCPPAHRGKIVVCLHGWYDNLGRYCYDHASGTLQENWQAFANPRGRSKPAIPMSKAEMHGRIQFAKERGFRVILYFADSTNCTGAPAMAPGQTFVQADGQTRPGWAGPCGGGGPLQDPSSLVVLLIQYQHTGPDTCRKNDGKSNTGLRMAR